MYSQRVRSVLEPRKLLTAPPETTVEDAVKSMANSKAGAVLVVEGTRLVGIFTERDAVFRVMAAGKAPKTTRLAEVMTREPFTVGPNELFGRALHLMYEHGFRHLPVVENGAPIGIVSARSALDPDLEEFVSEARRRTSLRVQDRNA
jgi:CBS domain-containing protein